MDEVISKEFIVVLGAPNDEAGKLSDMARSRLELAARLLAERPSATLVLTGGYGEHFNTSPEPHAEHARRYLLDKGMPAERLHPEVVLSGNTAEDARLTHSLLESHLPCEMTVVTSDFHAARAGLLFRSEFGASPVEVICASTPMPELIERLEFELDSLRRSEAATDKNISLAHHGTWVTIRVAAVVVADEQILLQQADTDFWFLPGGRVQVNESTGEAIRRELIEELPFPADVDRLLWTVENFFNNDRNRVHEIGFYFLALPRAEDLGDFTFTDGGTEVTCRWFPLSDVAGLDVRPAFLREALDDFPPHPQHVVVRAEV